MKRLGACTAFLAAIVISPGLGAAANVADFIDFSLRNASNQVVLPGRLYVPPEATSNPGTPRPLILFLHGGGEVGTNNTSQVNVNIDNLLAEAKQLGAFLYAPQSTTNWNSTTLTGNIKTMIDRATSQQNVDEHRLYVTGLSNGGGGTWNMLNRYPGLFAAGLPICGVSPASDFVASRMVNQPIWAFHARDDTVVSVGTSRSVLNNILAAAHVPIPAYPAAGSPNDFFISNPDLPIHKVLEELVEQPQVTQYKIPGSRLDLLYYELFAGGHAIWNGIYGAPPVYGWLFSHTTAVPEPNSLIAMAAMAAAVISRRQRRFK